MLSGIQQEKMLKTGSIFDLLLVICLVFPYNKKKWGFVKKERKHYGRKRTVKAMD